MLSFYFYFDLILPTDVSQSLLYTYVFSSIETFQGQGEDNIICKYFNKQIWLRVTRPKSIWAEMFGTYFYKAKLNAQVPVLILIIYDISYAIEIQLELVLMKYTTHPM